MALLVLVDNETAHHVVRHIDFGTALRKGHTVLADAINQDVLLLDISTHQDGIIDIQHDQADAQQAHKGDEEV